MNTRCKLLLILLCGAWSTLFTLPATAEGYIGEVCWLTEDDGDSEEQNNYIKLGCYLVGYNHFTVNGFSSSDGDQSLDERTLLNGNAELFSDQVVLHMTGSSSDIGQFLSLTVSAKISPADLNGTFEAIDKIFDRASEELGEGFQQCTLTFTACPTL